MKSLKEQIAELSPEDYAEHCKRLARTYLLIHEMQVERERRKQAKSNEAQQEENNEG